MQSLIISAGNFLFRHRNWVFPVLVVGFFALAVPSAVRFNSYALEHVEDCFAILVAFSGLALRAVVIGHDHVRRSGEGRNIHAAKLFTTGIFSLCRNPLYTGNILIFMGIFLMHGGLWTVLLGSISYVLIYYAIVKAEEDYLLRTFGKPYADYSDHVPRWIPNLFRISEVTAGLPFNVRRVLLVEYTNIGITVIALAIAELYEELGQPVIDQSKGYNAFLFGIIVLALVWVLGMRFAKKRRLIVA
jgi:protein-S-isoprenylcysteine O-methyltransferase Ste14